MSEGFKLGSVDVDVGVSSMVFQGKQAFKIHVHRFADLDSTKGKDVASPPFSCFNHEWEICLYPGGGKGDNANEGMLSFFVQLLSKNEITVSFGLMVLDSNGEVIKKKKETTYTFNGKKRSWGWYNIVDRSVLLEPGNLNNGTLTIELRMKLDQSKSQEHFIPENLFAKHMMKIFLDEETADALFEVSGEQCPAHLVVLKACAPELYRLCDGYDKSTPIPIPGVEPQVFRQLLQYVYGGKVDVDWEKDAKKFIDAAHKHGISGLKVEAEARRVTYCDFTVDNVVEELLYADAMECPLLREVAMKFILENAEEVIKSDSFNDILLTKEITKEIMLLAVRKPNKEDDSSGTGDGSMSVDELRMALSQKGLDTDGSIEMLTSRLKM